MRDYQNPALSPRERAEDLLKQLSLEEKMAQTVGIFIHEHLPEQDKELCRYGIGAVSTLDCRCMKDKETIAAAQREYQEYIMAQSPHQIPAMFHMEGLCGAFIQDATSFPAGIGRGASFDPELEQQIGAVVGRQERCFGITQTLAPLLDIGRESRLGRQGETYGEDPTLSAALGSAYVKGAQGSETAGRRTDCVAKHFIGFHNSEGGIHGAASNTPRRMLTEIYGKGFQAAVTEADLKGVMPCYCSVDGEVSSVSYGLLTELLRRDMGFDGLVVSDYSAIGNTHRVQKLFESLGQTGYYAMAAGMDMELPVKDCFNDALMEAFRTGQAPMEVLDRAVLRILEAKFRMGLFEHPFSLTGPELDAQMFCGEEADVSLRSARQSLVLLKNDGILPLKKKYGKIALIGPHANNARSFFGGYTHLSMAEATLAVANSLAGIGPMAENGEKVVPILPGTQIQSDETEEFAALGRHILGDCPSLLEYLRKIMPETQITYARGYPIAGDDTSGFAEALAAMDGAELCILTMGGKHGSCSVASMGEGVDAVDINLPYCQDAFMKLAAEKGIPLVGLHFNGRAISSDVADAVLNAILECWNPSQMGAQAIAETLLGENNPSGKLPVTVAYVAAQEPLYYNHPNGSAWHQGESIGFQNYVDMSHQPRYHFGHGLSYTEFSYSDLQLSSGEMSPLGSITVSLKLKNVGLVAGTEVVQLYIRDRYASMVRPCMELAGFRRVRLEPGQERMVTFTLQASQLAFLDLQYRWLVEKGDVDLLVGASSQDIRLKSSVRITENTYIDGKNRAFWA